MLPEHPIVSAQLIEERFQITNETARLVLLRLQSFGILSPVEMRSGTPGRPVRWWVANELMDIIARSS